MMVIPALVAGSYHLEVVTQYNNGTLLKDKRTTTLDKILTVA